MTPPKKTEPTKAVTSQPQLATPAVATEQKPATPTKQQQTMTKLIAAWTDRGIEVSKLERKIDGKFMLLQLPNFPVVRIGSNGGIDLPTIKSYAKAFDAAVNGDQLLKKQQERETKKTAASVPAAAAKPEEKKEAPKESTTQKKQRQEKELEKVLA